MCCKKHNIKYLLGTYNCLLDGNENLGKIYICLSTRADRGICYAKNIIDSIHISNGRTTDTSITLH
jgi:hypothetical protein